MEVSIPRKLYDEWEPTIKIKIKNYEFYALCDLGASVSTIPKTLCDLLYFRNFDDCSLNLHLADLLLRNLWEVLMMFLLLQIGIMCP